MAEQRRDAFDTGVRALARRDLSTAELITRLTRAGIDQEAATEAAEALREAGYLSDERAARERARVLAERGLGDRRIDADLRSRGLSEAVRHAAIDDLAPERQRAEDLVERARSSGAATLRLLLRKGYDEDVAWSVSGEPVADES